MPNPPRLDPDQELAVTAPDGAVLVLAAVGSGKTRLLASRVSWLLGQGVPADGIMVITTTRRAGEDLRRRLRQMLARAGEAERLRLGPLGAQMARALRTSPGELLRQVGRDRHFTVWDEDDRMRAWARLLAERGEESLHPADAVLAISRWKSLGLAVGQPVEPTVAADLWPAYEAMLASSNAFDPEDLVAVPGRMLAESKKLRSSWSTGVRHLLVDDFQNVSAAIATLLESLASVHGNLYVTGDDTQGLGSERGGRLDHLREFSARHPGAEVFRLNRSYRSSAAIGELARAILAGGEDHLAPALVVERSTDSTPPTFRRLPSEQAEARFLAAEIRRLTAGGIPAREIAVLVREPSLTRPIAEALDETGVDYRQLGAATFWGEREIRDALAWLRLIRNPRDEAAARRALAAPGGRGIGDVLVGEVAATAYARGDWVAAMAEVANGTSGTSKGRASLRTMAAMVRAWSGEVDRLAPADLVEEVLEGAGLFEAVDDGTDDGEARVDNLSELIDLAMEHPAGELDRLLEDAALDDATGGGRGPAELVTLSTIAAARGLEWRAIFLAGCEEGVLPAASANPADERRLFYVAVTRAKQRLVLTAAAERASSGERGIREVSRFVRETADALTPVDGNSRLTTMTPHRSLPSHDPAIS